MSDRERFQRVMQYEPVDRRPLMLFEPYEQYGVDQWRKEGLPAGISPDTHFGIERIRQAPLNLGPIPTFEQEILSETEFVQIDWLGATVRRQRAAPEMYYGCIDQGLAVPGTSGAPPASLAFPLACRDVPWEPPVQPEVIVIYQGTNDPVGASEFQEH